MALFTTFFGKTSKANFRVMGPKYGKAVWTCSKENPNRFGFGPSLPEIKPFLKQLPNLTLWPFFPHFGRTRFFPDMRFAPKCRVPSYLLFKHSLDTKSMVRFFAKCKKPSKITFFTTFSQISENPDFS